MSEIISYSSRHEKSVLCRVSRLSRQRSLTPLYRRVSLDSYEELYRLGLGTNGVHVASFVLHLLGDPFSTQPDFEIPQELDYIIFNAMTRLETPVLNVPLADARCTEIFRDCSFPRLSTLQYVASEISCNDVLIPFTHGRCASLIAPMAKLTTYVGPSSFMGFVPRGIAHIGLLWTDPQPDVLKMFESLSTVTRGGANLTFSCLCEGQPLARYLARYLPKVEAIQLQESMDNRRFEPEDLEWAAQILQSFTTLRYFAFNFMAPLSRLREPARLTGDEYHGDKLTVEDWGRSCPSLRECCLHGYAWRQVQGEWETCAETDLKEVPPLHLQ
ncbi:hypothetical protein FB45DRAFT_906889 [Roridomyces roridus]|uniref:Uncharacterized protein n=1 Tax=Roridomyces roridus TaxID=1738132 RepID=A0AAD7C1T8_9AGAR|nr:hypothetical protein FB45DRAFT_906889 [Roridomyces roridus]